MNEWMNKQVKDQVSGNELMNKWMLNSNEWMNKQMNELINDWMIEETNEWIVSWINEDLMNKQMNEW